MSVEPIRKSPEDRAGAAFPDDDAARAAFR